MDISIYFPLCDRLKDAQYVDNLSFKRALQLLYSHGKLSEYESAINWFYSEKSKIESKLNNNGSQSVDISSSIDRHFGSAEESTERQNYNNSRRLLGL